MTQDHLQAVADEPKTTTTPLDRMLCFTVYSAGLAFNRVYKPMLDELGLTYPQYLAMVLLWHRDGQTVSELGEQLSLESNTLTPMLKRLEASGFITRRRDGADERVVRVSLTPQGRSLAGKADCIPDQLMQASGATPEAFEQLNGMLAQLRDRLRSAS